MSKKMLRPPAVGYQFYAYPAHLIFPNQISHPWFFSNFFHIRYDNKRIDSPVPYAFYFRDYSYSPWLITNTLSKTLIQEQEVSICDLLKKSIENGRSVYIFFNEFHISHRAAYRKFDHIHDALVINYDAQKDIFDILGYDINNQWAVTSVNAKDIDLAFNSYLSREGDYFDRVLLYKFNGNADYKLDTAYVQRMFQDYYDSTNISKLYANEEPSIDWIWGYSCHDAIIGHIYQLISSLDVWDVRIPYFHSEHKHCTRLFTEFLCEKNIIRDRDLLSLIKKANQAADRVIMLYMRSYQEDDKTMSLQLIVDLLTEIKAIEKDFYPRIIEELVRYNTSVADIESTA